MTPIPSDSLQFTPIDVSGAWTSATGPAFHRHASVVLPCKTQNKVIAGYALCGVDKTLGIAACALPDGWKGQLPSVEASEQTLGRMRRGRDE